MEIIRRIGGRAKDLKVTFSSRNNRPVNVEGSAGLRMRFGVEPSALVADIRECERVCAEEEPDQALEFVEYVHPVSDAGTKDELDAELERLLAGSPDVAEQLIPVVPTSVLEHFGQAQSFTIRIGRARTPAVPMLDLADFLRRTRPQRDGERVTVLRGGHVNLNADDQGARSWPMREPTSGSRPACPSDRSGSS